MNVDNRRLIRRALPEELPSWGVLILESHHADDFEMEWRTHDFVKLVYVLTGSGRLLIGDDEHRFATRNVVVIPPGNRNRIIDDPRSPSSLYVLCVAAELFGFDLRFLDRLPIGTLRLPPHLACQIEKRLRRLAYLQLQCSPQTPIAMVSHSLDILAQSAREFSRSSERLADAGRSQLHADMEAYLEHLRENFYEASDIDDAARMLGVSRRTFTAAFREKTGQTWLAYVTSLRCRHACRLLESTSMPILSIAFECGYAELSTFYRRFKDQMGTSPGRYRELAARAENHQSEAV